MRRFLALSRSTHGALDLAMTGFAALLWLGHFPAWPVLLVALVTAAAGYTALYALNDLLGVRDDKAKFSGSTRNPGYAVEASALRHPIAQGRLGLAGGITWFGSWYLVALAGAWWLNPVLVIVVLVAPVLETTYCLLLKVTPWRALVGGLVKSLGPVAAVLVVVPRPSAPWLGLMIAWLVAWEIGGQNIPADWNDVEEDRRIGAKTIPQVLGPRVAGILVVTTLGVAVILSLFLPVMSPLALGWPYRVATLAAGSVLLLQPAMRLLTARDGPSAAALFDRASLYPVAQLAIITLAVLAS